MKLVISRVISLNPEKFLSKEDLFQIIGDQESKDCVSYDVKADKKGKSYNQFNLLIAGSDGDTAGEYELKYLFERDLKFLVQAYGSDTQLWIGKQIVLSAKKDNGYNRWIIRPVLQ